MTIKARLQDDVKTAMKARDADRLLTLRGLLAAIKQREVDERIELDDAAVVAVLDKLVKQRKDSIAQFGAAGRTDLVEKETAELAILVGYLPARLDEAALLAEVRALVAELGATGPSALGKVMAAAKLRLGGKADMASVSAAVKQALNG